MPLNSPFFKNISRTDIKMKNSAINPIPNKTVTMAFYIFMQRKKSGFTIPNQPPVCSTSRHKGKFI
ncbi:hypothetical protein IMPERIA89_340392 [Imperialibacter sp. 89]|nr:hypothetical protein IMPERIA89_340392 [Imperialibacter sp. 89]